MRIEEMLQRLCGVSGKPSHWVARCPSHKDRFVSLSIKRIADGSIHVRCCEGCSLDSITQSLGMKIRDLFADNDFNRSINDQPPPEQN